MNAVTAVLHTINTSANAGLIVLGILVMCWLCAIMGVIVALLEPKYRVIFFGVAAVFVATWIKIIPANVVLW